MKLSDEELFALIFTFKNDSNFKTEYLKNSYVIERTNSGVGFFSTIKVDESVGHFANSKNIGRGRLDTGICHMVAALWCV
ncbi:hypothetical protein SAMN05216168_4729 [Kosakonia radicincitans]|uniref:hypothetical protein n=1 Tax=Kosakonia radicincitans TaxID=283686 RepID=UPI0009C20CE1|nr:hypothetical protein [Kosakonia radicincitans]SKC22690.1 hypothetical protein SAMN05216168_4729 [Kosakonia radicincitans]